MIESKQIITLFSSESTIRYIKDVFSVLALPRGSVFQFRYDTQYIDPRLLAMFSQGHPVKNIRALIVFRSASDARKEDCFFIPVRWASVEAICQISNGYTVDFSLEGYPNFTQDYKDSCSTFAGINQKAQSYFLSGTGEKNKFAAWGDTLSCVQFDNSDTKERDSELWFQIVSSIAKIPKYQSYLFIKCSSLYTEQYETDSIVKSYCEMLSKHTALVEESCVYVDIEYYSAEYEKDVIREIDIYIDENILRKSKGLHHIIESRYGTMKIGFQSKKTANHTVTEIVMCSKSSNDAEVSTDITYPIIVIKNRKNKIIKAVIMAIGALLVALPGILGAAVATWINVMLAGAGVIVLGVNTYWESKE